MIRSSIRSRQHENQRKIQSIFLQGLFGFSVFLVYFFLLNPPIQNYIGDDSNQIQSSSSVSNQMKKVQNEPLRMIVGEERLMAHMNEKEKKMTPSFLDGLQRSTRIALVNMNNEEWFEGMDAIKLEFVQFDRVSSNLTWKDFFPGWIDEEEKYKVPSCPKMPLPNFTAHGEVDVVVAALPCKHTGIRLLAGRDLFRLQVNLVAANIAARRGRRDGGGKVRVVFRGECSPMMEIFRCDDLERREGEWWMYEVEVDRLEEKVAMPVGSCRLALRWSKAGIGSMHVTNKEYEVLPTNKPPPQDLITRHLEAYATVLHSSDEFVCGAITLARSLLRTGTERVLVLLHDDTIPDHKLHALATAGWKLHLITRIRNPHAKNRTYNANNYTKLRLWQLTAYRKVVFIDSDVLVLRNLDMLFHLPQLSAVEDHGVIFNSGVMVIEPSMCVFEALMDRLQEIIPYNDGDQGFLNEVFLWWHRLPCKVNYMTNFWSNTTEEVQKKDRLFTSDPPELYSIHYFGMKPWMCYRDYDCNWDVLGLRVYASDAAHWRWWTAHDLMPEGLRQFCGLTMKRKASLEGNRRKARDARFADGHWKVNISDERRLQ